MHLSIASGIGGGQTTPRKLTGQSRPLGQRFDRQLYPAGGEIDNPQENWQFCLSNFLIFLLSIQLG